MKSGHTLGRGVAYGVGLSLLTAWPVAATVTLVVESRDWSPSAFIVLRLVHQLLLWGIGALPAFLLLRRDRLRRPGAMAMACSPLVLDALTALAFGMWPLVLGSWLERLLCAAIATGLWLTLRPSERD